MATLNRRTLPSVLTDLRNKARGSIITPADTADPQGVVGDITSDASYVYVKTSAGWKRAALSTF